MTLTQVLLLLLIGLLAGTASGALGVGGAIIIIPAFVYIIGLSQHEAQGTSLTLMLPPVGALAFYNYYKQGFVNLKVAVIVMIAFFIGGYFGSLLSIHIPDKILRKVFGGLLLIVAIKMIFEK